MKRTRTKPEPVKAKKKHPYQVPHHIYLILEQTAEKRRRDTGKNIIWSGILREILDEALGNPSEEKK